MIAARIDLTRIRRQFVVYFCLHRGKFAGKHCKVASFPSEYEAGGAGAESCRLLKINSYAGVYRGPALFPRSFRHQLSQLPITGMHIWS